MKRFLITQEAINEINERLSEQQGIIDECDEALTICEEALLKQDAQINELTSELIQSEFNYSVVSQHFGNLLGKLSEKDAEIRGLRHVIKENALETDRLLDTIEANEEEINDLIDYATRIEKIDMYR